MHLLTKKNNLKLEQMKKSYIHLGLNKKARQCIFKVKLASLIPTAALGVVKLQFDIPTLITT